MSIVLTYWEDAPNRKDPEDFDGLFSVVLKSVSQIPDLIALKPAKCTMISTERSAEVKLRNGKTTNYFKRVWEKGEPIPRLKIKHCPLCNRELK